MKKHIAMLLAFLMCVSVLPVSALGTQLASQFDNFVHKNNYQNDTFSDVSSDDWFAEDVKTVYETGLMVGKGNNTFDPDGNVTLAETATIAARIHSIFTTETESFEQGTPWFLVYVDYCMDKGIVPFGFENAYADATRAAFADILSRALPAEALEQINTIPDGSIPDVTEAEDPEVYLLYRAGVLTGNDEKGTFAPFTSIRRCEVAAIIARMIERSQRKSFSLANPNSVEETQTLEQPSDNKSPFPAGFNPYLWGQMINEWIHGGNHDSEGKNYTVTFDGNIDDVENVPSPQTVNAGERVQKPLDPIKTVYVFTGWYLDTECTSAYDFNQPVNADFTLYAGWESAIYCKPIEEDHLKDGVLDYNGQEYDGHYIDNELIFVIKDVASKKEIENIIQPFGGRIVGQIYTAKHFQVEFPGKNYSPEELRVLIESIRNADPSNAIETAYLNTVSLYQTDTTCYQEGYDGIEYAVKTGDNYQQHTMTGPVSPDGFDMRNWWLTYTHVYEAKELLQKSGKYRTSTIGIIDLGFLDNHEDLSFTQIVNYDPNYMLMSDLNLFKKAFPTYAHGMHVAGIIGAKNNNPYGITGINDNANLFAFNTLKDGHIQIGSDQFYISNFGKITPVAYLIEISAGENIVINHSLGYKLGSDGQFSEKEAKSDANKMETLLSQYSSYNYLIVDAAGNDGIDALYGSPFAAITQENIRNRIIVVGGASAVYKSKDDDFYNYLNPGPDGSLGIPEGAEIPVDAVSFNLSSNHGDRVDILAPCSNIISTVPKTPKDSCAPSGYMMMNGTSQAAPIVTGIASLVWRADPSLSAAEVKRIIINTASDAVIRDPTIDVTNRFVDAESAVAKALGFELATKEITFDFKELAMVGSPSAPNFIKAGSVKWDCISYSGNNPYYNSDNLSGAYIVMNGDDNSTIDTVNVILPYGNYKMVFSANGYKDKIIEFTVGGITSSFVAVVMTPVGETPLTPVSDYSLSGFVYDKETNDPRS